MRILITDVTGFTGPYLAELLLKTNRGSEIYGAHCCYLGCFQSEGVLKQLNMIRYGVEDLHDVERMLEARSCHV